MLNRRLNSEHSISNTLNNKDISSSHQKRTSEVSDPITNDVTKNPCSIQPPTLPSLGHTCLVAHSHKNNQDIPSSHDIAQKHEGTVGRLLLAGHSLYHRGNLIPKALGRFPLHLINQSCSQGHSWIQERWEGELLEFSAPAMVGGELCQLEKREERDDCWVFPPYTALKTCFTSPRNQPF